MVLAICGGRFPEPAADTAAKYIINYVRPVEFRGGLPNGWPIYKAAFAFRSIYSSAPPPFAGLNGILDARVNEVI